jgi:RNA polymerase sigma-70 factor (ECF subfamily)
MTSSATVLETRSQILERIFVAHYQWLHSTLQRRMGDAFGAEDVTAETFAQVVALPDPEAIIEPRALLTTISRRVLFGIWRRRDLEQACLEALALRGQDICHSAEEQALLVEAVVLIDKVLDGLSRNERRVFLLYKLDRLGYEEIGDLIGLSPSQVRRIVAKGLRRCLAAVSI